MSRTPIHSIDDQMAALERQMAVLAKQKAEKEKAEVKRKAEEKAVRLAAAKKTEEEKAEKLRAELAKQKAWAAAIQKQQTLVAGSKDKGKGKRKAKSDSESEAREMGEPESESGLEVVRTPRKTGGTVSCERCADRGLRCTWPERKTKQKSCEACAEVKAACRMPGAEVKEPRKRRKVEDGEVGASKAKKSLSIPSQVAPLWELIEGLQDQLQRSNELRAEWLDIFRQEMYQTRKTFQMKMNGMMESGAELNETMGQMKNSLEFKLQELHTWWDGMESEDSEKELESESEREVFDAELVSIGEEQRLANELEKAEARREVEVRGEANQCSRWGGEAHREKLCPWTCI
jgi:hypothetical protein